MIKSYLKSYFFSFALAVTLLSNVSAIACTSAIISADLNPSGRPILWKHRDTSTIDNKVEYVPSKDGSFAYTALFNAGDRQLREAWMGMNEAGFAIMNTASYNIKDDKVSSKMMDKEGFIMTKALQTCRTIEDFAKLLESWPRPMGVEANFGVIDATGNGAYFETNNHSYVRYNLSDSPQGVLVRTNYSHSGRKNEGYGYVREANANHLLEPYIETRSVTPEVLTEVLSRTFYHDGKHKDYTDSCEKKLLDEDFIPRYKSTATIAIEGCEPTQNLSDVTPEFVANQYIMWTGIGYPPVAEIKAVRCIEKGVPEGLKGTLPNGHSALGDAAKKLRDSIFYVRSPKGNKFVDVSKLYNAEETGLSQKIIKINKDTYRIEKEARDGK